MNCPYCGDPIPYGSWAARQWTTDDLAQAIQRSAAIYALHPKIRNPREWEQFLDPKDLPILRLLAARSDAS